MMYLLLVVGFVLLIKGADFFVDGSSAVAKKLRIPPLIIGMTIVAMGTSLPETSVSVSASLAGKNDLSISNAVGSNIFNLMIVAGFCAILCPLPIGKDTLKKDFPFSILAAGVLLVMGAVSGEITRIDGILLLLLFAFFLYMMIRSALKARNSSGFSSDDEEIKNLPGWQCLLYIIGGIAAIAFGGKMVVESASDIARNFGMTDNLIGMTIVALGTSLPELVTSIVAARKNEMDMALGNVIGSNIFNILFVLGIAAAISPIGFTSANMIDTAVLIASSLLVLIFCLPKRKLVRWNGASMVAVYAGFTVYLFLR
ncbi:MAG: calcium/sodium antiporter [Ruminococcus sp.]|nr:calcium/sodium antiporter [Ruminococcus sp.]